MNSSKKNDGQSSQWGTAKLRTPHFAHRFGGEDSRYWRGSLGEISMGWSRSWFPHPAMELNSRCQLNISLWSLAKGCRCSGSLLPCHVSSLGKALPWRCWEEKLSLFLLLRSEIINQSSTKGANRALLQDALRCSTLGDNKGHQEMPAVTLAFSPSLKPGWQEGESPASPGTPRDP